MPISAFVVSYNRDLIIEACLRSLRFADELIVIDKGSSDKTVEIAESIADRVYRVDWSPTVEGTRIEALELCKYDNIIFLDDDECLSVGATRFFKTEDKNGFSDGYSLPCKQFILGRHSPSSYYWPERKLIGFKKGAVQFSEKVHSGVLFKGSVMSSPHYETDIYFSNLSYVNAYQWLEKSNRYTSQNNRTTFFSDDGQRSFYDQMKDRLHYWMVERTSTQEEYDQVVAALRAIYDLVDFIKRWENKVGIDGDLEFKNLCNLIIEDHMNNLTSLSKDG